MKVKNLRQKDFKQLKSKVEDSSTLEDEIKKALSEKYKPKDLCNLENLRNNKDQREVA